MLVRWPAIWLVSWICSVSNKLKDSQDFPLALIVDSSQSATGYLERLEQTAGLRWVLTHHLDAYKILLLELSERIGVVVIDFTTILTEKLRFYLELVRSDSEKRIPVIFLPDAKTKERAQRIKERNIDRILVHPFLPEQLETLMGELLGRSERKKLRIKFWLYLQDRTIEGYTTDLSGSGMGGTIADPILFSNVRVRLFSPDEKLQLDLLGVVRRKQRQAEGGYALGIAFERVLEGDPIKFGRYIGVSFSHLKDAGEATRASLDLERAAEKTVDKK